MGRHGRAMIEARFDERSVIEQYASLLAPLQAPRK